MENSKEVAEEDQTAPKPETPLRERILTALWLFPLLGIILYGSAVVLFSTPVNRVLHYEQECTISSVGIMSSGTKSYSSSSDVVMVSPDCPDYLEFKGKRRAFTNEELVERLRVYEGQKVTVDMGVWQFPFAAGRSIVGVEGLDLSK